MNKALRAIVAPRKQAETDGRRRRSQDSRDRIVAAMLELVREGETTPGAEQVATRANVGLRTVFRHFNDMDSLYREMSRGIEGELMALVEKPLEGKDWRERMAALVQRRAVAFERIAPYRAASEVHRHTSPVLQADHDRLTVFLRGVLKGVAPQEAQDDPILFAALEMVLSIEAWIRLRYDQGLSVKKATQVIETTVFKLLG